MLYHTNLLNLNIFYNYSNYAGGVNLHAQLEVTQHQTYKHIWNVWSFSTSKNVITYKFFTPHTFVIPYQLLVILYQFVHFLGVCQSRHFQFLQVFPLCLAKYEPHSVLNPHVSKLNIFEPQNLPEARFCHSFILIQYKAFIEMWKSKDSKGRHYSTAVNFAVYFLLAFTFKLDCLVSNVQNIAPIS